MLAVLPTGAQSLLAEAARPPAPPHYTEDGSVTVCRPLDVSVIRSCVSTLLPSINPTYHYRLGRPSAGASSQVGSRWGPSRGAPCARTGSPCPGEPPKEVRFQSLLPQGYQANADSDR